MVIKVGVAFYAQTLVTPLFQNPEYGPDLAFVVLQWNGRLEILCGYIRFEVGISDPRWSSVYSQEFMVQSRVWSPESIFYAINFHD